MRYWMFDEKGRGDSGPLSEALVWPQEGGYPKAEGNRPKIGCSMKVGSIYARSFSAQDYWLTTPIVEILEDSENQVKFKTRSGSIYTWKII